MESEWPKEHDKPTFSFPASSVRGETLALCGDFIVHKTDQKVWLDEQMGTELIRACDVVKFSFWISYCFLSVATSGLHYPKITDIYFLNIVLLFFFLSPGAQDLVSVMPCVSWLQCWATWSLAHWLASPRLFPSCWHLLCWLAAGLWGSDCQTHEPMSSCKLQHRTMCCLPGFYSVYRIIDSLTENVLFSLSLIYITVIAIVNIVWIIYSSKKMLNITLQVIVILIHLSKIPGKVE